MSRVCTVCRHEQRSDIDYRLAERNGSIRTIADRFDLSHQALLRHRDGHLAATISASAEMQRQLVDIDVFARLVTLDGTLSSALDGAMKLHDYRAVAALGGRVVDLLALYGRLKAELSINEVELRRYAVLAGLDPDLVVLEAQRVLEELRVG